MHTEKTSEIIAHFIGHFDAIIDEVRMRIGYTQGEVATEAAEPLADLQALDPDFASQLLLKDFGPGVAYKGGPFELEGQIGTEPPTGPSFQEILDDPSDIASAGTRFPHFGWGASVPIEEELEVYTGPGSTISHMSQFNLLQDDDYLNMTGEEHAKLDTSFVVERLAEYATKAAVFTPFAALDRTDVYGDLVKIADDIHAFKEGLVSDETTALGTDADVDFVLAGNRIDGTYVDGELIDEAPVLEDLLPDRGIAKPPEDIDEESTETSIEQTAGPQNILDVGAGANVVANIAAVTNTGVIAPTMSVMGDYHQVDMITQAYIYSDNDTNGLAPSAQWGDCDSAQQSSTVAMNIALFERHTYGDPGSEPETPAEGEPTFPSDWRVSVIEGDVCFVQWIEQYNFITDNDQMIVTTTGSETSVLLGGNVALNITAYLGISMQYDLVIVGGDMLDMNIISQLAVLYDNDWIIGADGCPDGIVTQTGNNLLWNQASIQNVGDDDRFETMPDYMNQTVQGIQDGNPDMPQDLATDVNFSGYEWLNVLYITGNLYDVTYIKQVSVLGDADHVTQVAAELLANNEDAQVTIDTGSNAVVNIAEIIDYDSFGDTTYIAGHVYSDAILIQGGIIEDDPTQPQPVNNQLANEVIAFLDDDPSTNDTDDAVINAGNDLSWSNACPSDVMQSVIA